MTVPSDKNTSLKTTEKLLKYRLSDWNNQNVGNENRTNISCYIGTLGLTMKGLEKHMEKIPGAINISEPQKKCFISHSSHTKEVFVLEAKFISPLVPKDHG